ncbi:MAG TPA: hypothetical protein VEG60_20025 [Candidatus Binatia bacterium]|nr:hypothetical protein [Candidatus Binatia bacterium]
MLLSSTMEVKLDARGLDARGLAAMAPIRADGHLQGSFLAAVISNGR